MIQPSTGLEKKLSTGKQLEILFLDTEIRVERNGWWSEEQESELRGSVKKQVEY